MEYRGQDTITKEEAGHNKHFIYVVWLRNSVLQEMVVMDWMGMDKVKCVQEVVVGDSCCV